MHDCTFVLQFTEEDFEMRTQEQHTRQCSYIDRPGITASEREHYSMVYGINRTSILCQVPHFDVTAQLPQDLMHILLEGVFPMHIGLLLTHLIHTLSLTIVEINARISSFPYAYFEEKPCTLTNVTLDVGGRQTGMHNLLLVSFALKTCSQS